MSYSRLDYLFGKYYNKTATAEERAEFMEHVVKLDEDDPLFELMEAAYLADESLLNEFTPQIRERILSNVFQAEENTTTPVVIAKTVKLSRFRIWSVAAAVVFCLGISLFFYYKTGITDQPLMAEHSGKDIAAGGNKAVLTLGNGRKIVLDEVANGELVHQDGISISKTSDGQLVYHLKEEKGSIPSFNTIETPNGGQYQVNLPDGTRVWLNAGTVLKYPTLFGGTERKVELVGEAYFEVARDAHKPFKVKLNNDAEVQVLGTHFNVNAYKEEKSINTTLLEGAVMVKKGSRKEQIIPGQQAQINRNQEGISLINGVNVNQVIAWKNGFFSTDAINLDLLMKQVEKWYDVKVVYTEDVQAEFVGKLPRNVSLTELLRLLELTKKVHFNIEGRTIKITR